MKVRYARAQLLIQCVVLIAAYLIPLAASPNRSPHPSVQPQWPLTAPLPSTLLFPWLPSGQSIADLGPWYSVATVQNIEDYSVTIEFWQPGDYVHPLHVATLPAHGMQTFTPTTLRLAETDEGPHAIIVTARPAPTATPTGTETVCTETFSALTYAVRKGGQNTADTIKLDGSLQPKIVMLRYGTYEAFASTGQISNDGEWRAIRTATSLAIDWRVTTSSSTPDPIPTGATYDVILPGVNQECTTLVPRIAGAVKLLEPLPAPEAITSPAHVMVSGYTAIPLAEFAQATQLSTGSTFVDTLTSTEPTQWAFPIVQRNNGWESVIHLTNLSTSGSCKTTIDLFPSSDLPLTQQPAHISIAIGAGVTRSLSLTDLLDISGGASPDWVGQAWISASCPVIASVDRVKRATLMALTNTPVARSDNSPRTVSAPLVFQAYYGWNSGINISNLSETETNLVTVTFYDTQGTPLGKAERTLAPGSMAFVYRPSFSGAGIDGLSQATISGTAPLAVAVDAIKYQGAKREGQGQALSYLAQTGAAEGETLALPLLQKGGVTSDDTSGLNLFNMSATTTAEIVVHFFDSNGHEVPGSTQSLPLTPHSGQTLYTPNLAAVTPGFRGTAVVSVRSGGPVSAVSNNVNYAVAADGATTFHLPTMSTSTPLPRPATFAVTLTSSTITSQIAVPVVFDAFASQSTGEHAFLPITFVSATDHNAVLWFALTDQSGHTHFKHVRNDPLSNDQVVACIDRDFSLSCDAGEPRASATVQWVDYRVRFDYENHNNPMQLASDEEAELTVQVDDKQNHLIAHVPVLFSIIERDAGAKATLSPAQAITNTSGLASTTVAGNQSQPGHSSTIRACVDVNRNGQCDSTPESTKPLEPSDDWEIQWIEEATP